MMLFLRSHWRFLLIAFISLGLLIFTLLETEKLAEQRDGDFQRAESATQGYIQNVLQDVKKHKVPANVFLVKEQERLHTLQKMTSQLAEDLNFQLHIDYSLEGAGESISEQSAFYLARLEELTQWLEYSRFWKPSFHELGYDLTDIQGTDSSKLRQKLIRLDLLRRVAKCAYDNQVYRVREFQFMRQNPSFSLEQRLSSVRTGTSRFQNQEPSLPMLQTLGMSLEVEGEQFQLLKMLRDLQATQSSNDYKTAFGIERYSLSKEGWKNSANTHHILKIELVAYTIAPQAQLPLASLESAFKRFQMKLAKEGSGHQKKDNGLQPSGAFQENQNTRPARRRGRR